MFSFVRDYLDRVHRSLTACYQQLEQPRAARHAVVALLTIHSLLLAYSASVHSPTLNEPAHLVAGLSIWNFGRFDVYNVNPPLVKMMSALPVIATGYEEDWSGFYSGAGMRPEYTMGEDFVRANGKRTFFLMMIARWACIPFSWLGAIVCYLWGRDLYGRPSGVAACAIWCFEPNIIAHASLITPDAHATAIGLAACYTFWRWLKKPTWSQAALTGVVLGLAELTKTTLILFYPIWPMMWMVYRWADRKSMAARDWLREGGMLALRMTTGLYVLNLGYGFEGAMQPLGKFHFVSEMFTGIQAGEQQPEAADVRATPSTRDGGTNYDARNSQLATSDLSPNRFANTWLASIPSLFPRNYLLGIDLQQKEFEHYRYPSYLQGKWRDHGWWYYYLYAAAIKVPLGLWVLGVFALITTGFVMSVGNWPPGGNISPSPPASYPAQPVSVRDLFILLFPALVIFAVVSSKTGMNEHMRYVLPCFPFIFVGISGAVSWSISGIRHTSQSCDVLRCTWLHRATLPLTLIVLLWSGVSSLWIYPHSLSYFNEAIGGPLNGSDFLVHSNIDWGQDLRYILTWTRSNPTRETRQLFYFGSVDPSVVGYTGNSYSGPHRKDIFGKAEIIASKTLLEGHPWPALTGKTRIRNPFLESRNQESVNDCEQVHVTYSVVRLQNRTKNLTSAD